MEASNSEEPFNNVEEELKKSHFSVYNQAQNSSKIGPKYYARKEHTREVKKQVVARDLKHGRTLKQT